MQDTEGIDFGCLQDIQAPAQKTPSGSSYVRTGQWQASGEKVPAKSGSACYKGLAEQIHKQQKNFQRNTYTQALSIPLSYAQEGLQPAQVPIGDYDELTVEEVSERLKGLSTVELRMVRDYGLRRLRDPSARSTHPTPCITDRSRMPRIFYTYAWARRSSRSGALRAPRPQQGRPR